MRLWTFLLLCTASLACSAPAQIRDLQVAEDQERSGQREEALQSYRSAQVSCHHVSSRRKRADACSAAYMQYAELLVTMGRITEAITAYHDAESELQSRPAAAAQACYAAATLYLQNDDHKRAYTYLWKAVTDYPNESFATDAVKTLVFDGRKRAPKALYAQMQKLSDTLSKTQIADNLLRGMADLQEHEFSSPQKALQHYDQLVALYRHSGFYDDALWHGARISRQSGDARGAVKRLRKLLSTREVAFGAGSYFSLWLDNAQLELGLVLRDDLQDYPAASKAFSKLPSDYPASILKDDALFERAVTKARAKMPEAACKDLQKLHKEYPDGKYELLEAPKLRASLGCSL